MSNAKKLADLKEAQAHIEGLERLNDLYPEIVPTISDAEAIEMGTAIADRESQNRNGRRALNH